VLFSWLCDPDREAQVERKYSARPMDLSAEKPNCYYLDALRQFQPWFRELKTEDPLTLFEVQP